MDRRKAHLTVAHGKVEGWAGEGLLHELTSSSTEGVERQLRRQTVLIHPLPQPADYFGLELQAARHLTLEGLFKDLEADLALLVLGEALKARGNVLLWDAAFRDSVDDSLESIKI